MSAVHCLASPIPEPIVVVVDLDGTLILSDSLVESLLTVARKRPLVVPGLLVDLVRGRSEFKAKVADIAWPDPRTLPYNAALLDRLRAWKSDGAILVLATAANERIANEVAAHLGIFDAVLASTSDLNLKGSAKLFAIRQYLRENNLGDSFVYAGDSSADLPIWSEAAQIVYAGHSAAVYAKAITLGKHIVELRQKRHPLALIRSMRLHQWTKNLLIFVPFFTAFQSFEIGTLFSLVKLFLAMGMVASGTYLLNDLLDLESDRMHPTKRHRPLAAGHVPLTHGIALSGALVSAGLLVASTISTAVLALVGVYIATTVMYSVNLKEKPLVDVLVLAGLYTLRIIAGGETSGTPVSQWLFGFSIALFFSLALLKRAAELIALRQAAGQPMRRRGYAPEDLQVVMVLGGSAAIASVLIFGLFLSSPEVASRYRFPEAMTVTALMLLYWISRLWLVTARGRMTSDPIVFSLTDRVSLLSISLASAAAWIAHSFNASQYVLLLSGRS